MKITLPLSAMRAMIHTSADADIRYYLNGVHVIATKTHTRLESTNGHYCGIFVHEVTEGDNEVDGLIDFIVPLDEVKMLKPSSAKSLDVLTIEYDAAAKTGTLNVLAGMSVRFNAIDGKFPDLDRVTPKTATSGAAAQYQVEYFAQFAKVAKLLAPKKMQDVKIWHNGNDVALITLSDEPRYLGLLMPLNSRVTGESSGLVPSSRFNTLK
jgi:DNA polymerase III sliding clamp (beta) subunit (PCNA family)